MDIATEALLIVDPDPDTVDALTAHLMTRGYVIHTSHDREHASRLAGRHRYSAFILGLSQAEADPSLCRHLRDDLRLGAPIVVVSESSALATKLQAFRDGADDFLVKPLSPEEIELRIGNRILRSRRKLDAKVPPLRVGDLVMHTETRKVERAGVTVRLTPTLYRILQLLMIASPDVVTRHKLLRELWNGQLPQSDSLRSHLYALRKQVNVCSLPPLMHTVRTTGVRLAVLPVPAARNETAVSSLVDVTAEFRDEAYRLARRHSDAA